MEKAIIKTIVSVLCFFFFSFPVLASEVSPPLLEVIAEQSKVVFIATQNHVPVEGRFTRFTSVIHFSEKQLDTSSVRAEIDLTSVQTDYDEIAENLKSDTWFDTEHFSTATFESSNFIHKDGNNYEAVGTVSLHGHTLPVTLAFTLIHEPDRIIKVEGKATLKRSQFMIGTGEWGDNSGIDDEVIVKVTVVAKSPL